MPKTTKRKRKRRPAMTAEAARDFHFSERAAAQVTAALAERARPGCTCQPYQDVYTYARWRAQGLQVRRGEHGWRHHAWVPVPPVPPVPAKKATATPKPDAPAELTDRAAPAPRLRPRVVTLFCRCQVAPMAGAPKPERARVDTRRASITDTDRGAVQARARASWLTMVASPVERTDPDTWRDLLVDTAPTPQRRGRLANILTRGKASEIAAALWAYGARVAGTDDPLAVRAILTRDVMPLMDLDCDWGESVGADDWIDDYMAAAGEAHYASEPESEPEPPF